MKALFVGMVALALVSVASGSSSEILRAHGVALVVPAGWHRVPSADDAPVTDPRTLLVVGTAGARPKSTHCQIGAYSVPERGAVVVVVGWKSATSGGGQIRPGRRPLQSLSSVRRPSFECFAGRGAAAQLVLGGRAYQVNVMVGDSAPALRVAEALAVGRSFRLSH